VRFWSTWRRATEAVASSIEREVHAGSGLSAADYEVLFALVESGGGTLPQRSIRDLLGWEKSRTSIHLTRMERRGLVVRTGDRKGGAGRVQVTVTRDARRLLSRARPLHATSVRSRLVSELTPVERTLLERMLVRIMARADQE
jgi:DNA-binding MarR family transcriptional regulator